MMRDFTVRIIAACSAVVTLFSCSTFDPAEQAGTRTGSANPVLSVEQLAASEPSTPVVEFVPAPPSETTVVDGEADRLAVGDTVRILVLGQEELSLEVPVPPSGAIEPAVVGSLYLLGRTCSDVAAEIQGRLAAEEFLVDPKVSVVVTEFAPRQVFVVEGVRFPKAYDLPAGRPLHLTQLISLAGGLVEGAEPSEATILRRNGTSTSGRIRVDLEQILGGQHMDLDPVLEPGDTVIVPDLHQGEGVVYVTGQVKKAGAYRYSTREGLTFFQAIVLAGGLDKYAKASAAVLLRDVDGARKIIPVDLEDVLSGDLELDVRLRSQDVIFVPESFF